MTAIYLNWSSEYDSTVLEPLPCCWSTIRTDHYYFIFYNLLVVNRFCLCCSKSTGKIIVGIAHHVSFTRPYGLFDVAAVTLANSLTLFPYVDSICDKLDFIGINYYGQVSITTAFISLKEKRKEDFGLPFTYRLS